MPLSLTVEENLLLGAFRPLARGAIAVQGTTLGAGDALKADGVPELAFEKGEGMSERQKLLCQLLIAFGAIAGLYALGCAEDGTPWARGMTSLA